MNITKQPIDWEKLHPGVLRDVREYARENRMPEPTTVYDVLHYYLMWNGIIGYTGPIAGIVSAGKEAHNGHDR